MSIRIGISGWHCPRWAGRLYLMYSRLHGPEAAYAGRYPETALRHWAGWPKTCDAEGKHVHVLFDKDRENAAVFDTRALGQLVSA